MLPAFAGRMTHWRLVTDPAAPDIDSHVGVLLRYAQQRALRNLTEAIRGSGLTPMQVSVLARLTERGPTTQNKLGRSLAMEPANVHDVVQRLHRRRLVALDPDPADRRAVRVSLTASGRALLGEVWPQAEAANQRTLAPLSAAQRETLTALLHALVAPEEAQADAPGSSPDGFVTRPV